jgi:ABC-2 type transport system ATP-binding protein
MAAVIEVTGLRKEYRHVRGPATVAVDSVDFEVAEGGVFGFLGPNGAGKTTTIRCLLGLCRATGGRAVMLGAETPKRLASVIERIGAIVETPTLYPHFSGRRNLSLLGGIHGIGTARVTEVLERVGLADRADDLTKHYSLGMRQRLGLAAALLKDPELLILDEPANGLDPGGMVEMRHLLRALADEGRTVFVSSHLLAEVQLMCDRVAILSRGRCVANGPVRDVLAAGDRSRMVIRLDRPEARARAEELLAAAGFPPEAPDGHDPATVIVPADHAAGAHLNQVLGSAGVWVAELRPEQVSLEDVFLDLTGSPGTMERPAPPPAPAMTASNGNGAGSRTVNR